MRSKGTAQILGLPIEYWIVIAAALIIGAVLFIFYPKFIGAIPAILAGQINAMLTAIPVLGGIISWF